MSSDLQSLEQEALGEAVKKKKKKKSPQNDTACVMIQKVTHHRGAPPKYEVAESHCHRQGPHQPNVLLIYLLTQF